MKPEIIRPNIDIYGFKIGAPFKNEILTVTKKGYCLVLIHFEDSEKTNYDMPVWTDKLPKQAVSADVFIQEFNNQLNAILK